jgi:prophage regulatory protein
MKSDVQFEEKEVRYVRLAQLVPDLIPVSRTTIWRWVRANKFPAPIKLTRGVTVWLWAEVNAWLSERTSSGGAN